ncbi:guanine nucleotide exchange factor, putative [Entamoeba histolytica HM-1:IMSS-B]|uniref:Guanine nucleotide exchange factor, putative n=6 Tax=Entamoeba histolytica TaxID=5759 RepID=C4M619_ENTH1|nr:guanine nucleotide exchange factor, putative [Entamoeba histolytica HM-1:IMSS]EMD47411.1 rho/RAC guanine nucleotide exchange factor, putative [Entamoeba histolytica KU27]EMH72792.1 guanine nucleotide exchange factor, putative [Entamoeba histolytica HM-1:IMSS-B]EMS14566.1 Rho/RAC guanine nucleotide exchange factor, putative [Entamoeba histolytica HM-3:IMSS]ENY59992.1 Rho/RAC guanine nucleotide exchange factor, putative [Entamoeba histolytica HM-1:IMSS-A]GAT96898.1 guanine nucleotide exchange|eukprot:XP_648654.1 guanine nucleotide exchange factor, putative [Entamoeba histolytica HM-1:IMSS]
MDENHVFIEHYPVECFAYDSDVSRWSNKRLVKEMMKEGKRSLAFRLFSCKITGKQMIELKENECDNLRLNSQLKEELFQYVKKYQKIASINILQRAIRRHKIQPQINEYIYRGTVINEIITTEINYVDTLQYTIENIKRPLENNNEILNYEEQKTLFSNIETVFQINKVFCSDLIKGCCRFNSNTTIGNIFLTFIPFLKVYNEYCSNFRHTIDLIKTLKYPHKFAPFYSKIQYKQSPYSKSSISDLLITPVQRLPRYQLLLKDLLKHTQQSHIDYNNIKKALEMIQEVANKVNETSKINELTEETQKYFSKTLHIPEEIQMVPQGRILIKTIKVNGKADRKYVVMIFNDSIIIIKEQQEEDEKEESYTFKFFSKFNELIINIDELKKSKSENLFSLQLKNKKDHIVLCFSSVVDRSQFKSILQNSIDKFFENK